MIRALIVLVSLLVCCGLQFLDRFIQDACKKGANSSPDFALTNKEIGVIYPKR